MILLPRNAKGVTLMRHLNVFGYDDAELRLADDPDEVQRHTIAKGAAGVDVSTSMPAARHGQYFTEQP